VLPLGRGAPAEPMPFRTIQICLNVFVLPMAASCFVETVAVDAATDCGVNQSGTVRARWRSVWEAPPRSK